MTAAPASDVAADDATLQQVVQVAVDQVGATYGALAVFSSDGRRLERFVVAAVDEATRERIGTLPRDEGPLAHLVGTAQAAAPGELPPVRSIEVPLRVGNTVHGRLFLVDECGGRQFTEADAEAAEEVAAVAGLALANARLTERAERHRTWLRATSTISTALLSGEGPAHVAQAVASQVAELTGADLAVLLQPAPDDDQMLVIVAAVGDGGADFEGVRISVAGTRTGRVHTTGEPLFVEDLPYPPDGGRWAHLGLGILRHYGPRVSVPLNPAAPSGVLMVARKRGQAPFDRELLELLTGFTTQVQLALTLAGAQDRARRLQVQADRDRIARDLHDHVVQRLFATALSLDRLGRGLEERQPDAAERIARSVDELDGTISEIRAAIFDLHQDENAQPASLRARVADLVRQITEGRPLRRDVRVRGPVDELPAELTPDLLAVVRELVTNVVRHAAATRVTVTVTADDEVRVTVTDDGRGMYPGTERSGLANLGDRAARRGGRLVVVPRRPGTQVRWQVPRP